MWTNGGGMAMAPHARRLLESRLGCSLGDVRIHTGGRAAPAAALAGARAFAVGRDIVFGEGQYRPNTAAGMRLLAHEVAHVLQQRGGGCGDPAEAGGDELEHEAEVVAERILDSRRPLPRLHRAGGMRLQRAPVVLADTAKINVVDTKVKPVATVNLGMNSHTVANLTNNFDPDPRMVAPAFDFFGRVKVTGAGGTTVNGFNFGFLQFIRHSFLGIFYAGRKSSEGAISVLVHPGIGAGFLTDVFGGNTPPFMVPPNNDITGGEVISRMGDHPVLSVAQKQHNFTTGVDNFLFHMVDDRDAFSIFTVQDDKGNFQHLMHLHWTLRYDVKFKWVSGSIQVATNASTFQVEPAVKGVPADTDVQALLGKLGPNMSPLATPQSQKALKAALLHPNANRSDVGRWFNNVPPDFFS